MLEQIEMCENEWKRNKHTIATFRSKIKDAHTDTTENLSKFLPGYTYTHIQIQDITFFFTLNT